MAQGGRDIMSSASKITQQAPGRPSVTTGSAWILDGPFPIDDGNIYQTSEQTPINQTFLVTTNQVMRPRGGKTSWQAEFTPRKWLGMFKTDECYSIEDDAFYEVPVSDGNTKLILIPTEYLHEQKTLSGWRDNEFQSKRSLSCSQEEKESQFDRADAKQDELYCDVLTDQFSRKRYLFCVDDHGSYFLESKRNEVKLKNLKDFQPNEIPKGAIILDKSECGVGLLAFDDKGDICPLFFPQNLLDSNQQHPVSGSFNNNPNQPEGNLFLKEDNLESSGKYGKDQAEGQLERETPKTSECQEYERQKQDPQVDNYANEDATQNPTSQTRIRTLATQNSHHDQFSDPDCLRGDEGTPFSKTVMDPTPAEHKPTLRERHSNSQHGMDRIASMQTDEVSTEKEHVYAGSYVEKLILRKELIMDLLSLYLDRSIYPKFRSAPSLAKRWEHLADYCKVDAKIKKQCGISAHLSPSEAMFKYLCQSEESINVGNLKKNLLEISRKDVHDELANNQNLLDDDNMNDLCDNHPETLLNICLHLDDNRSVRYWYHLGLKIGISGEILRSFKGPSEFSPSSAILEKIATLKPKLPLMKVLTVLQEVEKWVPGISNVLSDLAVDSSNTIQTLLDKFEAVEKLTALLDLEERAWMHFGSKLGMERLQLNSLREESPPSPTKLLMKHIVAKKPDLTMSFFLRALKSIERFDVITELEKFFVAKDIADILKGEEDFTQ
ncbi:uncharacterized protein [Pocillopora verrucosa]|uniref:uncharacterized protein isoform X1 n=1 Tax=Pocillopora verrucosa TaxID=203993 RepID=UPI00334269F2